MTQLNEAEVKLHRNCDEIATKLYIPARIFRRSVFTADDKIARVFYNVNTLEIPCLLAASDEKNNYNLLLTSKFSWKAKHICKS